MKTVLIATGNPGKVKMFRELLADFEGELRFLSDFPHLKSPEENAKTVEGNAILKAKYYSSMTGLPAIADDAGMEIEELNDEPGVMARRWNGQLPDDVSDEEWIEFFMKKIAEVPGEWHLHGHFPFVRCLCFPSGKYILQEDEIPFYVSRTRKKANRAGWPMSDFRVFLDGRHEADVSEDDPIWKEMLKAKGLLRMLRDNLREDSDSK